MSHISRMWSAMFCGMPSGGRGMLGLSSVGRQPCSSPFLPALVDALLDVADRVEIFVELALVGRADLRGAGRWRRPARRPARSRRRAATSSLKSRSKAKRRIELQRRRASSARSRRCASCRASNSSCGPTGSTSRSPAPGSAPWSSGRSVWASSWSTLVPERISPPEASGAPESRLPVCELWMLPFSASLVVEAADEEQLLAEVGQRREHLAQLHVLALALGPPLLAVKAVAGKEHGQPDRGLAGRLVAGAARRPRR